MDFFWEFGTKSSLIFLLDLDKEHVDQGATDSRLKAQEVPLTKAVSSTKLKTGSFEPPFQVGFSLGPHPVIGLFCPVLAGIALSHPPNAMCDVTTLDIDQVAHPPPWLALGKAPMRLFFFLRIPYP